MSAPVEGELTPNPTPARPARPAGLPLVVVALTVLALVLGWAVSGRLGTPSPPNVVRGGLHDVVEVAGVNYALQSATTTAQVVPAADAGLVDPLTTVGTWLVIRIAYQGADRPGPPASNRFEWETADGARLLVDDRFTPALPMAQPGEWWAVDVLFELPPEAVGPGTLHVYPEGKLVNTPMEIGAIRVDEVAASTEVLELVEATAVEE